MIDMFHNNNFPFSPVLVYVNVLKLKIQLLKDSKDKIVVYRWVNAINNKTYVGSSVNLQNRLYKYFSEKHGAHPYGGLFY